MPINTVEDLPRAERDAKYARIAKLRNELRDRKWEQLYDRSGIDFSQFAERVIPDPGQSPQSTTTSGTDPPDDEFDVSKFDYMSYAEIQDWINENRDTYEYRQYAGLSQVVKQGIIDRRILSKGLERLLHEIEEEELSGKAGYNPLSDDGLDEDDKTEVLQGLDQPSSMADFLEWLDSDDFHTREFADDVEKSRDGANLNNFVIKHLLRQDRSYAPSTSERQVPLTLGGVRRDTALGIRSKNGETLLLAETPVLFIKENDRLMFQIRGWNEKHVVRRGLFYLLFFADPYEHYERGELGEGDVQTYRALLRQVGIVSLSDVAWKGDKSLIPLLRTWRLTYKAQKYYNIKTNRKGRKKQLRTEKEVLSEGEEEEKRLRGFEESSSQKTESVSDDEIYHTPKKGGGGSAARGTARGLKMSSAGDFGEVHIDVDKLRSKYKLQAQRKSKMKINQKMTRGEAIDLYDLLTKRFNPKKQYEARALELFAQLRDMAGFPKFDTGKHTLKQGLSERSYQYYKTEDLLNRLRVLFGAINAGNSSKGTLNELSAVLDQLLNRGVITEAEYAAAVSHASAATG